jgi:6-phosphogluconolactonase
MKLEVLADADSVARSAAMIIAKEARAAVAARDRFVMAVSGGSTPWLMLRALAREDMPWNGVQIVQVDERVAPEGDPDRNLTHLYESLLEQVSLRPEQIHAMPVEAPDLNAASEQYATTLRQIAGSPGDPVLDVADTDVALTAVYKGRRRMTLTYPILNRGRIVLWLVTGNDKAKTAARLYAGDTEIPAGRVQRNNALLLVDRGAAGQIHQVGKE